MPPSPKKKVCPPKREAPSAPSAGPPDDPITDFHHLVLLLPLAVRRLAGPAVARVQAALGDTSGTFHLRPRWPAHENQETVHVRVDAEPERVVPLVTAAELAGTTPQSLKNRLTRGQGAACFERTQTSVAPSRGYEPAEPLTVTTVVRVRRLDEPATPVL